MPAPLPFPACSAVQGPCGKALPAASHGAAAGAARAACHGSACGWCSGHQARQVTGWCARWGFVYAVKLCCDCCFSVASAALARRQCMQVKGFVAMLATLTCYPGAVAACRAAGTSRRAPFRAASSRGPGAAAAACGAAAQDQAQVYAWGQDRCGKCCSRCRRGGAEPRSSSSKYGLAPCSARPGVASGAVIALPVWRWAAAAAAGAAGHGVDAARPASARMRPVFPLALSPGVVDL